MAGGVAPWAVPAPPRNVEALVDAIKSLLSNAVTRRTYADAARKYAEEQFDLWRNSQRLASLLRCNEAANCRSIAAKHSSSMTHYKDWLFAAERCYSPTSECLAVATYVHIRTFNRAVISNSRC